MTYEGQPDNPYSNPTSAGFQNIDFRNHLVMFYCNE